jgi:polysaccharide biosynthesis/export protein
MRTKPTITVVGQVLRPGVYPVNGPLTIEQAFALAKGPTPLADRRSYIIQRGHTSLKVETNARVEPGDKVEALLADF